MDARKATSTPKTIYLRDYQPPAFWINHVDLTFELDEPVTTVTSRLEVRRNLDLEGEAEFTHDLPSPPTNLYPAEDDVVSHEGFTASFDPVTTDTEGDPIDIELYVVVVEKEDDDPILQTFEVILPPTQTSVKIPGEFLEEDTEYKLEVIAQEESGNRTITEEGSFTTDSD